GVDYSETAPEIADAAESSSSFGWLVFIELLKYGVALVLVVGLIFLVLKLLGVVNFKVQGKKKPIGAEIIEEPDPETPLDVLNAALNEARKSGNYREAVRLLYCIALSRLALSGKVTVKPEKTNWEYVSELRERTTAEAFGKLTGIYELIWFGEGRATEEEFKRHEPAFQSFINSTGHEG
ncbi:MAG: DUF4129 domain-containing protein, partial [Flavobacteriales bacterium]|nr:DUF4129 domain-containing protein [Flavobacteriales bacterium]